VTTFLEALLGKTRFKKLHNFCEGVLSFARATNFGPTPLDLNRDQQHGSHALPSHRWAESLTIRTIHVQIAR
jgi:hypothetical protein